MTRKLHQEDYTFGKTELLQFGGNNLSIGVVLGRADKDVIQCSQNRFRVFLAQFRIAGQLASVIELRVWVIQLYQTVSSKL